jgi:hypothetical protein
MPLFIFKNQQQLGPYEESEVQAKLNTGDLSLDDLGWKEGLENWVPLRDLYQNLQANKIPSPPPLPNTVSEPLPIDDTPSHVPLELTEERVSKTKKRNLFQIYWALPWPVKIVTLPLLTLLLPFGLGGVGFVGVLGFGALPVILVFFVLALAVVGVITLIRSLRGNPEAAQYIKLVLQQIAHDDALLRAKRELRKAMAEPIKPERQQVPKETKRLQKELLQMDDYDFEKHVLSFFSELGMIAAVTKKSSDCGVDGWARHPNGLIVVQCKRYSPENPVGRPIIQQFKGVIEENQAWRGYIVTTSYFTSEAKDSAEKNDKLRLIDMDALIDWHVKGLKI